MKEYIELFFAVIGIIILIIVGALAFATVILAVTPLLVCLGFVVLVGSLLGAFKFKVTKGKEATND